MIKERDREILRCFLIRESLMFKWGQTGEKGRIEFVEKMFHAITECRYKDDELPLHEPGFNYVRVQSITNMGLLDSELVLSGDPWSSQQSIICCLPPSPRGNVSFSIYLSGSL